MLKTCEQCGGEFTTKRRKRRFCSLDCANQFQREHGPTPSAAEPVALPRHGENPERDLEIAQLREALKRYRVAYTKSIKERAHEERLIELFSASIAAFPTIPTKAFRTTALRAVRPSRSGVEEPVLLLSDQQIGEVVSADETHGINRYDFDVYQQRLEYLEERVLDILLHHQRERFEVLHVLGLGDNISGRIHAELEKHGAQHVIDQVYIGALTTALFLWRLRVRGGFRIRYVGVSGNHGRLDDKKESKAYYKNFDYLFNSILATALRGVDGIEVKIPKAIFTVEEIARRRVLVSHGMELPPSSLGIPLYSINRASAGYQELLAFAEKGRFDLWVMGHFHRPMELDGSIVNGTMVGISEHGIGKFKPIRPLQKLLGLHSRYVKAWEYPIRLDFAPEGRKVYTFEAGMGSAEGLELLAERMRETA